MVSIIIPVYNAAKYLRRCLDSVVNQTYRDIEIIIVDDGSTDGSGAICDEYAATDRRLVVIHQNNGGVCVARQTGLDCAKREYSIFIDSDDWVDMDMLLLMLSKAVKVNADIVSCGFYYETRTGWEMNAEQETDEYDAKSYLQSILSGKVWSSLWNKLFRTSLLKKYKFYPPKLKTYEDTLFLIKVLLDYPKITVISNPFYHYTNNTNSLINNCSESMLRDRLFFFSELDKILPAELKEFAYGLKSNFLGVMLYTGHINLLMTSLPEIHEKAIERGKKYNWKFPLSSCLSIALRGYPRFAYILYTVNIQIINSVKKIKKLIKN